MLSAKADKRDRPTKIQVDNDKNRSVFLQVWFKEKTREEDSYALNVISYCFKELGWSTRELFNAMIRALGDKLDNGEYVNTRLDATRVTKDMQKLVKQALELQSHTMKLIEQINAGSLTPIQQAEAHETLKKSSDELRRSSKFAGIMTVDGADAYAGNMYIVDDDD